MSTAVDSTPARNPYLTAAGWRRLFRDRPMIPLLVLLGLLVIANELVRPGIVSVNWAGTILRAAVPLAILAGCQTIAIRVPIDFKKLAATPSCSRPTN